METKTETETIFYSVPSIDYAKIQTLNQFLDHVFPLFVEQTDNPLTLIPSKGDSTPELKSLGLEEKPVQGLPLSKNTRLVIDTRFLKELAYGIQCLKYFDSKRTLLMIVDKMRPIRIAAYLNNPPLFEACNCFITHFIESTKTFASVYAMKEMFFNNPIILEKQFIAICHAKKIHSKKFITGYAQALADDIFIMNSRAFLSLSIPIDPHHRLVEHFNKLVGLISEDLSIWLKLPAMLVFKMKIYLETAKKLILVNDYHGAAAIEIAFQIQQNALQQHDKHLTDIRQDLIALHDLYSEKKNYLMLRNQMRNYPGIPFFSILCRDLDKANENKQISDRITIYGKLYFTLAEEMRAVAKQIEIQPSQYQTDLATLMRLELPITTKIPEELFIEEKPLLEKLRLSTRKVTSEEKVERKNSKEQKKKQRSSMDETILEKNSLSIDEQVRVCNRRSTIANLGRFFSITVSEEEDEEEKRFVI